MSEPKDSGKRDFDKGAATWDDNPMRVKMAADIMAAMLQQVPVSADMDVLEFGCGTGLVTLQLAGMSRTVTGVDSSTGMLDVLSSKIRAHGIKNITVRHLDIDEGGEIEGKYHLVVSSMVLHHIRDIAGLLARFHRVILPGGMVCVADLDAEDGSFHGDNTGIFHRGFDRTQLRAVFEAAGFSAVRDATAVTVTKKIASGETHSFPVFVVSARKNK